MDPDRLYCLQKDLSQLSLLQNSKNTLRQAQGERYFDYSIRGEPVEPQLILLQEAQLKSILLGCAGGGGCFL
jgi:hypothetical protein